MSATAALIAALALGASEPANRSSMIWGGDQSCATWLSSSSERNSGNWWIWGFWSGRNAQASTKVGGSTDANGIIGEVKLYCEGAPSATLVYATTQVFLRFKAEGR